MRTIKFRVFDKSDNVMRDVLTIDFENGTLDANAFDWEFFHCVEMYLEDVELVQFTGLHDRAGKEIYEGDILGKSRYTGIVEYINGCYYRVNENLVPKRRRLCGIHGQPEDFEVIGNRFENPELLGGGE